MKAAPPTPSFCSTLLLALATTSAVAQSTSEIVISVGDAVPGLPGVTVSANGNFDVPVMDQNGTILVRTRLAGAVTTANDRAYLIGRGHGDLRVALRAGAQAPGLPAGILLRSSSTTAGASGLSSEPRISPSGEMLFFQSALHDPANPANTPTNADTALFWGPVANLQCLAREGDPIPFLPSGTWGNITANLQTSQINASGQVLFLASAVGVAAQSDGLLVTGVPGALTVVSREGDILPGGEIVAPIAGSSTLAISPQINAMGQVLHEMRFLTSSPSTATLANDRALAIWTPGVGETIVAREGQPAPGLAGVYFGNSSSTWSLDMSGAKFTRSGKTVFATKLVGSGVVTGVNDEAVYCGEPGNLSIVMRRGDACPGLVNGEVFGSVFATGLTCNDAGDVTFACSLAGPTVASSNDTSQWVSKSGSMSMLLREGNPIGSAITRCDQLGGTATMAGLNEYGELSLCPPGYDSWDQYWWGTHFWLWYEVHYGGLLSLAEAPGSSGTNNGDGGRSSRGQALDLVHRYRFTDGTAAIVRESGGALQATPASIPATGGTQSLTIDVGPAFGAHLYFVIAGASGTSPGFANPFGPQTIPLNPDAWLAQSINLANTSVYSSTIGLLDASGRASASFNLPPGLQGLAGTKLNHVVLVFDLINFATTLVSGPTSLLIH